MIDTPLLDRPNPADLPPVTTIPNGRELLTKIMGRAYAPEDLAHDVLDGVARNRPFIVSPRHARIPWYLYRLEPRLILEGGPRFMRSALRAAQRGA